MGRYRKGHRNKKSRGGNRNQTQNGDGGDGGQSSSSSYNNYSPQMMDADWILLEKYLLEYRSRAYAIHRGDTTQLDTNHHFNDSSGAVTIGPHKFLPLTFEVCKRPYMDLPDTLGP